MIADWKINRGLMLLLLVCTMSLVSPAAEQITIDFSVEHQEIDNFGASDCWSMQQIGAWSEENKARVADLLFSTTNGIGLSCWRFNLGAGLDHENIPRPWRTSETYEIGEGRYDWSRQANQRWFLGAAKARGVEQFVAFVNSPPRRMTRNGRSAATPEVGSTNLKEGYESQYARYLVDILTHFRDNPNESQRIDFGWISPVNEPEWAWDNSWQEGNRASNADIKRIVLSLANELKKREVSTKVLLTEAGVMTDMYTVEEKISGTHGAEYGNYLEALCRDPDISSAMGGTIGWHGYWRDKVPHSLVPDRQELRRELDKYPGWKFWQTEYCVMQGAEDTGGRGRDLGMTLALEVARLIHVDLTLVGVSAWQWWTAVSPEDYKDGLIYTDYKKPGDPETIYPSKLLWALGNFSRFIRPGARRIEVQGANDVQGLLASAYKHSEDGTFILVLVNMSEQSKPVSLKLNGLSSEHNIRLVPYTTSEEFDLVEHAPVSIDETYTVRPRSITTLVSAGTQFPKQ